MKIEWSEKTPRKIQQFPNPDYPSENPELEDVLTSADVDHVAQIFKTPLTGSYNWDYSVQDDRIKKLYELGKQLNWDPQMDINWDQPWPEEEGQAELMNLHNYPPYLALSNKERDEFWLHMNAWSLSQFLHGEQGALLVASQLCSCAPTFNAKLYAASQTFDEARHVEVFNQYIQNPAAEIEFDVDGEYIFSLESSDGKHRIEQDTVVNVNMRKEEKTVENEEETKSGKFYDPITF